MARVPASERTRNALKDMFAGKTAADKSSLVRQAARLIVEEALEKAAAAALGSGYYEHGADRRGYRNGYRLGRVKSAEGEIEFALPQLADMAEPFRSRIREVLRGRTEELERLAVEMYARGLSVRDIEAAFTDEAGRCLLSRTAASELTERLWADYQAFASRDLREFKLLYLFVDGIAEKLHLGRAARRCSQLGALSKRRSGPRHHRRCAGADTRRRRGVSSQSSPEVASPTRSETCRAKCPRKSGASSRARRSPGRADAQRRFRLPLRAGLPERDELLSR
jgi:hypothetical protein